MRLGIANQRIVVRTLELPRRVDGATALAAAVRRVAPDHIPMPMDEAVLDFQSLGEVETAAGPRTRVVVVAVRRETVERLPRGVRRRGAPARGHRPVGVRDGARAPRAGRPAQRSTSASPASSNVAVANERGCLFTRAAAGGLEAIASVRLPTAAG